MVRLTIVSPKHSFALVLQATWKLILHLGRTLSPKHGRAAFPDDPLKLPSGGLALLASYGLRVLNPALEQGNETQEHFLHYT